MKDIISIIMNERGETRQKIIIELYERPYKTKELSEKIGFCYGTIYYHLKFLLKKEIVEKHGGKYGSIYMLSEKMYENKEELENIFKFKHLKY